MNDHKISKHRSEKNLSDTRHKGKTKNTLNRATRKHARQAARKAIQAHTQGQ